MSGTKVRWRGLDEEYRNRLRRAGLIDGCGACWLVALVPDKLLGFNMKPSCDHHDFNYLLGCKEADRVKGDWQFYEELDRTACALTSWWPLRVLRPLYRAVAWLYYRAVRAFGRGRFYYADTERTKEDFDKLLQEHEA